MVAHLFPAAPLAAIDGSAALLGGLVLAGLVVVYALLRLRLGDFAKDLAALQRAVARAAEDAGREARAREAAAAQPDGAGSAVAADPEVLAALDAVEREVKQLRATTAQLVEQVAALAAPGAARPPGTLREQVDRRLRSQGYHDVRFLSDPDAAGRGPTRVAVEARKSGLIHKGHILVENGRVTEEQLTSAHEAFP